MTEFDWPVATVLLGTLATLAIAIVKWKTRGYQDDNGTPVDWREYKDFRAEVRNRLAGIEHDLHTRLPAIEATMQCIAAKLDISL